MWYDTTHMGTSISANQLLQHAAQNGIWMGRPGLDKKRYLRYLIEKGILPPRVAIRDPVQRKIDWRFPLYAIQCLNVLKELGTYPIPYIAKVLRPLMTQWHAEWDFARTERGEEGSIDLVTELGSVYLALDQEGAINKLRSMCKKDGMSARTFDRLLGKASENKTFTYPEMAAFLFILRRAWRLCRDPRRASIVLGMADLFERRLRVSTKRQ